MHAGMNLTLVAVQVQQNLFVCCSVARRFTPHVVVGFSHCGLVVLCSSQGTAAHPVFKAQQFINLVFRS